MVAAGKANRVEFCIDVKKIRFNRVSCC